MNLRDLRLDSNRSIVSHSYTLAAGTKDGPNVPRRIVLMSVDYEAKPPEVVEALATMLKALETDPPEPGEARDLTPNPRVTTAPLVCTFRGHPVPVAALSDLPQSWERGAPANLDGAVAERHPDGVFGLTRDCYTQSAPGDTLLEPGERGPSAAGGAPPVQRGPIIACQSQYDPDE